MKNFKQVGERITITAGSNISAGDPGVVGALPYVASVDIANGSTGAAMTSGVFELDVAGFTHTTAGTAVTVGAQLYYDSGVINLDATNGIAFGYALEAVSSAATTAIDVLIK